MSAIDLEPGWQSRPPAVAALCLVAIAATLTTAATIGAMPAAVVALTIAFGCGTRMQWARLDGPVLVLRDARTGYVDRPIAARRIAGVRFRRMPLPWCRLRLEPGPDGDCLVLCGASPAHPSLRPVTLWLIVHGRRRARIDPVLLDALAAMPEHGAARQPHDASPA